MQFYLYGAESVTNVLLPLCFFSSLFRMSWSVLRLHALYDAIWTVLLQYRVQLPISRMPFPALFFFFFRFSLSLQMSHILVEQAVESSQHSELEWLYLTERALGNIPRHRHTLAVLDRLDTVTLPKLALIQLSLLFCCYLGQQQPLSPLPLNLLSLYLRLRFCYTHTLLDLCCASP